MSMTNGHWEKYEYIHLLWEKAVDLSRQKVFANASLFVSKELVQKVKRFRSFSSSEYVKGIKVCFGF